MRRIALLTLALLPLGLGSCFALAAAGVLAAATYGVIKYTQNGAEADFETDLETTSAATVQSMRALEYPVSEDSRPGASEGRIEASDVVVIVARQPAGFTRVTAKVGPDPLESSSRQRDDGRRSSCTGDYKFRNPRSPCLEADPGSVRNTHALPILE